jgi:branched-chain amino acid transport system substrate-binding protein
MKRFPLAAALSATALSLAALPALAQQGVSKNEVVVGTVQDLSGPIAAWGKDVLNGMKLRTDEVNEQGGIHGRKIKLLAEDNSYDPKKTVLAAQKLVNQEKVFTIMGLMGSSAAVAAMPVLVDKNVLSFMPMSSSREMYEPPHKLKWGFAPSNFDSMKSTTTRVYQHTKSTKACALYQDDDFGLEVFRGGEAGLKEIKTDFVEKTTYKRGSTDFSSQIARLRSAGCDFVMLGTLIRETVGAISEARKLGWSPVFVGPQTVYTDQIPRLGGKAMDGLYGDMFVQFPYMDDASQPVRFWANKWKTQFGNDPTVYSVYGYLIADRLYAGMQKAGPNLNVDSFVKAMDTMTIPPDIFGSPTLTFSATKRLGSSASRVSQLQDGRWKVVLDYPKQ